MQQEAEIADELMALAVAEIDEEVIEDEVIEERPPGELLTSTLNTLREKIDASGLELHHPMVGSNEDYMAYRDEMLNAIHQDPLLLDTLLELFEQDPHSLLGAELAAVLSADGSAKAQTLALDMATNASLYTVDERAAALLMVAEMEGITPETRDGLLGNIQQETESDLTQLSLMALTNAPGTAEDYANVNRVLQETLYTDDANVRRHASYQIGEWATSDEDLEPLRVMAVEEYDLNARARAVMSLGASSIKSEASKTTLYAVVENDENPLIRLTAWAALKTYQLSDAENADYTELGERIQLDVEAYEASNFGGG